MPPVYELTSCSDIGIIPNTFLLGFFFNGYCVFQNFHAVFHSSTVHPQIRYGPSQSNCLALLLSKAINMVIIFLILGGLGEKHAQRAWDTYPSSSG